MYIAIFDFDDLTVAALAPPIMLQHLSGETGMKRREKGKEEREKKRELEEGRKGKRKKEELEGRKKETFWSIFC